MFETHCLQKYEWRLALAEKYLIAWIRGYQARKMYRAMKAENDRKKLSKEQRAANKKAKEKVRIINLAAKYSVLSLPPELTHTSLPTRARL